jgi:hypothetical protein
MWCKNCRQDVPAVASENRGAVRCVRCRGEIGSREFTPPAQRISGVGQLADFGLQLDAEDKAKEKVSGTVSRGGTSPSADRPGTVPDTFYSLTDDMDDWTLNAELQRIRRRFDSPPTGESAAGEVPSPHLDGFAMQGYPPSFDGRLTEQSRVKSSVDRPSRATGRNAGADARSPTFDLRPPASARRRSSRLAWGALSLGLMAFVCGAVLLGWSLAAGRNDLWSLGMPITLGGQFGLLLGLILQLESLSEGNRHTVDKLDEVDGRLDDLNQTAVLLSSSHSSPAQAFYVHMAGGASPNLLLADLKGQLDLLAVQMAATRR